LRSQLREGGRIVTKRSPGLSRTEQRARWIEAQAARNRLRSDPAEHDWAQGDSFSLASGERVQTLQCRVCLSTHFVYSDRGDDLPE
jgi:hypothetical protein